MATERGHCSESGWNLSGYSGARRWARSSPGEIEVQLASPKVASGISLRSIWATTFLARRSPEVFLMCFFGESSSKLE